MESKRSTGDPKMLISGFVARIRKKHLYKLEISEAYFRTKKSKSVKRKLLAEKAVNTRFLGALEINFRTIWSSFLTNFGTKRSKITPMVQELIKSIN